MWCIGYVLLILSFLPCGCSGDAFRFASYYGDHMVLQKAPAGAVLWGYGSSGAQVKILLSGPNSTQTITTAVNDGIWKVRLEPVPAGGPYNLTAIQKGTSSSKILLTDLLFGDVWLCGGQSNMAFTLAQVYNASEELADAPKYPNVRVFQAALEQSSVELKDLAGVEVPWSRPSAEILGGKDFTHFSAVCWLFGRYLYETLQYPVGLVESCWGGTPIETWSSPRVLQKCGLLHRVTQAGRRGGGHKCSDSEGSLWRDSVLWNAMIHPLLPMTIKGVIWYQDEANAQSNHDKYSCTFPAMIDDWRMMFHTGSDSQTAADFPFGFVQLCTYRKHTHDGIPEIRWHQTADYGYAPNQRMKNTFMAVALDLPDEHSPWGSIHPRDKQDVAYRLVLGARAVAYGEKGVSFQGPFPTSVQFYKNYLNITYNQMIRTSPSNDTFEICCSVYQKPCGSGSEWFPAALQEQDRVSDSVLVSVDGCSADSVAALRYAWSDWPCEFKDCPVYSADSALPAPPFIINRWPAHS
ncbi:sialate O-acetylesterase isoform X1 [Astyanax mexicanus]|uniref:sialate O-acetylesterase isoform X1 n=1 Tax=Astyanax mexicanus TaxID=7994 RepID=UPI0020CAAF79|nr:sialate O-acetylesterase isoform X1 [Astyanax mexicanus]